MLTLKFIFGAIGAGYVVYGRWKLRYSAMVCGPLITLCPIFTHNLVLTIVAGAALTAAPFFIDI